MSKRISATIRRFLGLALTAWLLAVGFAACTPKPLTPLRFGNDLWLGTEPFYLARDLGYYGSAVQLVEYSEGQEVYRAFQNGSIDLASTTLDTAITLLQSNPDLQVLLLIDQSAGADAMLAQPNVPSIQALKGRKVGVEPLTYGLLLLTRALESVGLTRQDVKIVNLSLTKQEAAFQKKEIDGLVTFEPVRSKLLSDGAKRLFDSRQIPGEIVDLVIGDAKLLATHQQQLEVMATGWFRALDYMQQHPQESVTRMAKRQDLSEQQFIQAMEVIHLYSLPENQQLLSQADPTVKNGAQKLSQFLLQNDLIKQVPDQTNLLTDQVVRDLSPVSAP